MITITQHINRRRCASVYFSKEARDLINSKEVVIIQKYDQIIIRKPSFDSNKIQSIKNNLAHIVMQSDDIVGKYTIEQEGDDFILIKL